MNEQLRTFIDNQWFQLAELLIVTASGVSWMLIPRYGVWFTLLAMLPGLLKWRAGGRPFHRTPLDWLIAILLITSLVGYWAAYDRAAAWIKFWLIVNAVLLYYALSGQPMQNRKILSIAAFGCAVGISLYFFLTNNFTGDGGRIVAWWIKNRPQVHWPAIHPGYVSGPLLLASIFAFYWLWTTRKKSFGLFTIPVKLLLGLGIVTIMAAFQLALPGGIWIIAMGVLGALLSWRFPASAAREVRTRLKPVFPVLVLACMAVLLVLLYLGPARGGDDAASGDFGANSRAQVLTQAAYLLRDYPITGSGLGTFPGLYSEYILAIPAFYLINSYNVFLDVAIEQGIVGGLAFFLICVGSIWLTSRRIAKTPSPSTRFFSCLSLLALIVTAVHGLFYDYLYRGNGTLLLLLPVGIATVGETGADGLGDVRVLTKGLASSIRMPSAATTIIVLAIAFAAALALDMKKEMALWYSDLGAVQMSQAELENFPTNRWAGPEILPALESARNSLTTAIAYDPGNATANYRLGIISMLGGDYPAAAKYLEVAHAREANHRGIIKSLGYCYVWLGKLGNAQALLVTIPEAKNELQVYVGWWTVQGRPDLSAKASLMVSRLESPSAQPLVNEQIP